MIQWVSVYQILACQCTNGKRGNVFHRHRFDDNPDPTFNFHADPDPNPDGAPSFTHFGKSESSALHLVEMDTDLDPPRRCRSDQIRIHNTGFLFLFLLTINRITDPDPGCQLITDVARQILILPYLPTYRAFCGHGKKYVVKYGRYRY